MVLRRPGRQRSQASGVVLVSFCNATASPGSSLAACDVSTGHVRVLPLPLEPEDEGATGIALGAGGTTFVALPGSRRIVQLDRDLKVQSWHQHDTLLDLHSLAVVADTLYAVACGTDSVVRYDTRNLHKGPEAAHPVTDSGTDTVHLNSLCHHDGRVLVTTFGEQWRTHPPDHRGGSVVGLDGLDVVSSAIRHPHSVTSTGDTLYVLGSGTGTIEQVLAGGDRALCAHYPGYVRGLAVYPEGAVVGVSGRRRRSRGLGTLNTDESTFEERCLILRFDATWNLSGTVDLSWLGREIYDIRLAPPGTPPPTAADTLEAAKGRITDLERWLAGL